MPLTDTEIRAAKPKQKPYKLFDERGLFLLVKPNGVRLWRFKYLLAGREKLISLGDYRDVPLRRAREKRDEAHIDSRRRSRQKLLTGTCGDFGNTFYLSHGRKPVCTIAAPELLAVLREFEIRRHPTVSADVLPEPENPINLGVSVANPTTPAARAFGGQGMSASRERGSTFAGRPCANGGGTSPCTSASARALAGGSRKPFDSLL